MAEVLRVGIAGLGEAATEFLPTYRTHPFIELVAAADRRAAAREQFKAEFGAAVYDSVAEMAKSPQVDAVYVATPHELHAEHVLTVLENGKHVIVEKPMALTLADCQKMNEAAARRGLYILCGHNHSYDAPVRKMREIVKSGRLGRLCMINTWNFNDFMVRPYPDQAIEMSRGVVLNQGPHQVDVVRWIGGGLVRSVRGHAGRWDESRPGEGAYACYLEFEDGALATLVFNGYGFFDTSHLFWNIGEGGPHRYPEKNQGARRNYVALKEPERTRTLEGLKEVMRYGSTPEERAKLPPGWEKGGARGGRDQVRHQPFFGLTVVTCEKGDMRQSPDGIYVYGDELEEVPIDASAYGARGTEIEELYAAMVHGKPLVHDGLWGQATIEVCLAILESTKERKEVFLSHQVPTRD